MNWTNQILSAIKSVFGMDHEATEQEIHAKLTSMKSHEELTAEITAQVEQAEGERYGGQIISIQNEKDALQTQLDTAAADLATLQADVARLTADAEQLRADLTAATAEVERLKKTAAAPNANGETDPPSAGTEKPWMKNPNNAKVSPKYR